MSLFDKPGGVGSQSPDAGDARTTELAAANELLRFEVAARKKAQEELRD